MQLYHQTHRPSPWPTRALSRCEGVVAKRMPTSVELVYRWNRVRNEWRAHFY